MRMHQQLQRLPKSMGLLALLVMLVKVGTLIEFHFGPAVVAFVLCVAMSMFASMSFDPHAIWEDDLPGELPG